VARTVFDVLIENIEDHRSSAIEVLAQGSVKDYAEYRDLCGLIRGLETAQREIRDLARANQDEYDE
jgi:hypothetical protein